MLKGMNRMCKIWLTADLHFGHKNVLKYENRPFSNTEEMDETLIIRWNKKVGENDIIFVLGDLFLNNAKSAESIAKRLNGRKHLILGNHDNFTKTKYKKMGFFPYTHYFLDDYILTHKPISESALLTAKNVVGLKKNIHGHVHSHIEHLNPNVHLCVSVELTNYEPISYDFINGVKKLN